MVNNSFGQKQKKVQLFFKLALAFEIAPPYIILSKGSFITNTHIHIISHLMTLFWRIPDGQNYRY